MGNSGGAAGGPPNGRADEERGPLPEIRVVDKRRFRPDGEARPDVPEATGAPAPHAAPESGEGGAASPAEGLDELKRAYAALLDDNRAFRQRMEREKERVVAAERAKVAQALLEAHDELELAWNASRASGADAPALRDLREGVRLTLQGLASRVAGLGAERIEVTGKPFDPATAEAVDLVAVRDESQDGVVVDEIRPGWKMGDRILRPARVRVGRLARA